MSKPILEDRKVTIQKEIEGYVNKYNQITNQRNELNRQLSKIQQEVTRLRGSIDEVDYQIKVRDSDKKKETPTEESDKKKK